MLLELSGWFAIVKVDEHVGQVTSQFVLSFLDLLLRLCLLVSLLLRSCWVMCFLLMRSISLLSLPRIRGSGSSRTHGFNMDVLPAWITRMYLLITFFDTERAFRKFILIFFLIFRLFSTVFIFFIFFFRVPFLFIVLISLLRLI